MSETRFKDRNWCLKTDSNGVMASWDQVHTAILMDIRDELKVLNQVFRCSNFLEIPHILRTIRRNTAKPRKVTKKAKAKA